MEDWLCQVRQGQISSYYFVDFIKIGKWLTPGKNIIALEVAYYPNKVPERGGQYEFPMHSPGIGLCIFNKKQRLSLSDNWKYYRLEAFSEDATWTRGLRGEMVYASKYPNDWVEEDFNDSKWKTIEPGQLIKAPAGMKQRPIPLPFINDRVPEEVTDFGLLEFPEKYKSNPIPSGLLRWGGVNKKLKSANNPGKRILSPGQLDRGAVQKGMQRNQR